MTAEELKQLSDLFDQKLETVQQSIKADMEEQLAPIHKKLDNLEFQVKTIYEWVDRIDLDVKKIKEVV